MKSAKQWDQDILNITMKIQQEFPELSKYIGEMPVEYSAKHKVGINTKNLEAYHHSLVGLLDGYSTTHTSEKVER